MKVLLFTENEYVTGGTTTFVKMLAANQSLFLDSGIEIKFVTFKGNPASTEYPENAEFLKLIKTGMYSDKNNRCLDKRNKYKNKIVKKMIRISNKIIWKVRIPWICIQNKKEIRKYLLTNKFDCVIANSGGFNSNLGMYLLEVAKKRGVVDVFLCHSYPPLRLRNVREKIHKKLFEAQVYNYVTHILTVSQFCACQIRIYLEKETPVDVIYNGMSKKETNLTKTQKISFLTDNRMPADTFIIGMIANFMPYKGILYFLEVLKTLRMQGRNIIGIIIGNAYERDYYEACQRYICDNQMKDYAIIREGLTNASDYVEAYDILCMPSVETESFGLVALEAASYSVPTVAFCTGGISEVIENGKSGYVVPCRNSDAMANAICRLIDNKQLYDNFCIGAHQRWKTLFSDQVMCENYIDYLKNIIDC